MIKKLILGMVFGLIVGVILGEMALILYSVITRTNLGDVPESARTLLYSFIGVCLVIGTILGARFIKGR